MACTIVNTPATGAADWTGWITQQGLTDRGFMRVSLTEFATTAASLIGTGSVFELAGSIYSCSDAVAISLAAGTASAAVSVYYVAIPSAGGTVCTFVMDDTAPTWVDAKQGYYASAASTSRYLGGSYVGTAATYFNKFIYTPDMVFGYLLPHGETRPLMEIVVDIGEWNMDASAGKQVTHSVGNWKNIRTITAIIRNDADTLHSMLPSVSNVASSGEFVQIQSDFVLLTRSNSGIFDHTDYNATASTVASRGWIIIKYEA